MSEQSDPIEAFAGVIRAGAQALNDALDQLAKGIFPALKTLDDLVEARAEDRPEKTS